MSRKAELVILFGTNDVGKSHNMKILHKINKRNLVLPPNRFDDTWDDSKELEIKSEWVKDPDDFREKRMMKNYNVSGMNTFTGNKKIHFEFGNEQMFINLFLDKNCFKNGGLFIDDYKSLIKGNELKNEVRLLFDYRRHIMLDIFMASHSFSDLTGDLMSFDPLFMIFKTTRNPSKSVLDKIPNKEGFLKTIKEVNQMAKEDEAKGKLPWRYKFFRPS